MTMTTITSPQNDPTPIEDPNVFKLSMKRGGFRSGSHDPGFVRWEIGKIVFRARNPQGLAALRAYLEPHGGLEMALSANSIGEILGLPARGGSHEGLTGFFAQRWWSAGGSEHRDKVLTPGRHQEVEALVKGADLEVITDERSERWH